MTRLHQSRLRLLTGLGWPISRGYLPIRMGKHWYWIVYRIISRWCSMVWFPGFTGITFENLGLTIQLQGYLPHGLIDRWWRCEGTKDPDKEPDFDYFL